MSEFAPITRPATLGLVFAPQSAEQKARLEQTRKVQPVAPSGAPSASADRPTFPGEAPDIRPARDHVAPPSLMQMRITAWLDSHEPPRDTQPADPGEPPADAPHPPRLDSENTPAALVQIPAPDAENDGTIADTPPDQVDSS